ncbi:MULTISPECIES: hypothetical protein [Arthrobacter]|uniref:Uncharacterized protein n=2 Tax=Arthrobacter TaxID=1663 RepID=A0ABU9KJD5_9MICC|nr:hypothetical protein [Arthrobacter sp. YJM1]MDP5226313.1 hypothetical protein [Arthrobacter sp. YJM1]
MICGEFPENPGYIEDINYGQWGLHLLDWRKVAARTEEQQTARPDQMKVDDIVIGEFLGDLEILIYAPSEVAGSRLLVALPLDPRDDWCPAGDTIAAVLEGMLNANGEKYWEANFD